MKKSTKKTTKRTSKPTTFEYLPPLWTLDETMPALRQLRLAAMALDGLADLSKHSIVPTNRIQDIEEIVGDAVRELSNVRLPRDGYGGAR